MIMTLLESHVGRAFRIAKLTGTTRGATTRIRDLPSSLFSPFHERCRSHSNLLSPTARPPVSSSCCCYYPSSTGITTRHFGSKVAPDNPPGDIFLDTNGFDHVLDKDRFKTTISQIRTLLGYPTYDIAVMLVDDNDMQETNAETRNVNEPTDVLSFPFHEAIEPGVLEEPPFDIPDYYNLGDVILDVPYVQRQCEDDLLLGKEEDNDDDDHDDDDEEEEEEEEDCGVSAAMAQTQNLEERLHMLLIHGMLHLVGYDHMNDDDYEEMINKEEELLQALGLPWKKDAA